ncbi:DNA-directed RNA polymerase subunit L [Candidatus Woesearchaeota archaeon]|nr:DNA-directed RNA polymerase subunit L [Candidatus Woesearchaeota archaeon]
MEIKVIEKTNNRLKIEIVGEDHTLANALRQELWSDKSVSVAGYRIGHSLVDSPKITVEVSKGDPVKVLEGAIKSLIKKNEEFLEKVKKVVK